MPSTCPVQVSWYTSAHRIHSGIQQEDTDISPFYDIDISTYISKTYAPEEEDSGD